MDLTIFTFLAQDGLIGGAVYALLAMATVLVFTVTRVIFVPQGEFVSFSVLTLAALQANRTPGTVWLLLLIGAVALVMELWGSVRERDHARALRAVLRYGVAPAVLAGLVAWAATQH